jgi:hypothetical protein
MAQSLLKTNPPPSHRATATALAIGLLLALSAPVAQAHIGSPNVFFEGPAGPYPIRVTIEPPGVVPGLAQIHVRVRSGDAQTVTVLPVRWDAGTRGAPPPDLARLVPGETNLFTAQLWLMDSGAYSVFVDVAGPKGRGTAIVPINSLAYQRLGMSRGMSLMFLGLGIFLLTLLTSVVGAAVRESALPTGIEPTPTRRRLATLAMAITFLVALGVLTFGNHWWKGVDKNFNARRLYRPMSMTPTIESDTNGQQKLILELGSAHRVESTPLVPDHGHLMHLFLVRQPQGDVFAHVHPLRDGERKGNVFTVPLPRLPAGDYALYADLTHESGLTQTLTNMLHVAASSAADPAPAAADPDDSFDFDAPQPPAPMTLPGGFRLTPAFAASFKAKEETTLRFELVTDSGAPASLEPYLGMYGHLMIQRADGMVFEHLHPLGSISMAAQKLFAEREHAGYLANQSLDLLCSPASPVLSFPYAFPEPGAYRLWLQVKLGGQVRTTAYTVTVE